MSTKIRRRAAALAAAAAGLAALTPALPAGAKPADPHRVPLVVRGQDTVTDGPCAVGVCKLVFTGGAFHGTPVASGAYEGTLNLHLADAFVNGEGGVCAPVDGELTFGAGRPDRLVVALTGNSCQDGAGNPTTSSFTTLTRFTVKHSTGAYKNARGRGVASFTEDAADHDQMTLIGHIDN
jgi:hypothetical protein